ncbi:TRAP transporter small permease [Geminicoccaceae bacterium 1502E]|nr:TRAP transporter small permease [Geminicoccaceae bacterium 1502E]
MSLLKRPLDLSEKVLGVLCVAAFATMFVLGIATVVFRFLLESSLAFPDELIRYLFVWMILLGSAVAFRRNMHAAIGMFVDLVPRPLQRAALLGATAASIAFFLVLLVYGFSLTRVVQPQISPALEVSMSWVYAAIPAGALFLLIYALEFLAKLLVRPVEDVLAEGGQG